MADRLYVHSVPIDQEVHRQLARRLQIGQGPPRHLVAPANLGHPPFAVIVGVATMLPSSRRTLILPSEETTSCVRT